jgi:CheY-like chemotaxis protein
MDGTETLEALRRLRPALPVVLSSGYEEETARRGFQRESLAGFLHKPYAVSALVEAIARACGASAAP